jgi:hypothetical protein
MGVRPRPRSSQRGPLCASQWARAVYRTGTAVKRATPNSRQRSETARSRIGCKPPRGPDWQSRRSSGMSVVPNCVVAEVVRLRGVAQRPEFSRIRLQTVAGLPSEFGTTECGVMECWGAKTPHCSITPSLRLPRSGLFFRAQAGTKRRFFVRASPWLPAPPVC